MTSAAVGAMAEPSHPLLKHAKQAARGRTGDLRHDLVLFAELLRRCGVAASPASVLQCVRALAVVRLDRRLDFRSAVECCLTSTLSERAVFDVLFDTFWESGGDAEPVVPVDASDGEDGGTSGGEAGERERAARATGERPLSTDNSVGRAVYGRSRGQRRHVSVQQRRDIDILARQLARRLGTMTCRRHRSRDSGPDVDLRSSLRGNLRFGEELMVLQHREPDRHRPRFALLCDVSSSMQPWTPFYLTFAHALASMARRVEVGVFNVDVSLVSDGFAQGDLRRAMTWLARQEVHRSGGTRIGHAVDGFLDDLERRGNLRRDMIVLVLSDGWDVGEPELLEAAMRRLRQSCRIVVWCDPHAEATEFAPQVTGLRIALEYVDRYVQLADVGDLAQLVSMLDHILIGRWPPTAHAHRPDHERLMK